MSLSAVGPAVANLIESFTTATTDSLDAEYRRLVGALWVDGRVTESALPSVGALIAHLDDLDDDRKGYLAILLGLLAEAEYPATDGEVSSAVREGMEKYLTWFGAAPCGQPLSLALLYLVSQFPGDRDRVLAVAENLDLGVDDHARLDRALRTLDPERPDIGRVFPSPAVWSDTAREFDQASIQGLTPAQVRLNWEKDTRTVRGYQGAKAYWAVRNEAPSIADSTVVPSPDQIRAVPVESGADAFAAHAAVFRCPNCGDGLDFADGTGRCTGCPRTYPVMKGILNLTAGGAGGDDFLYKLAEIPSMGHFYEAYARPAFLQVSGSNWGAEIAPSDEDGYIAEHVRPVDGPVLDLAAGAGRWTAALSDAVGAERVIALDAYPPMLTALRARLPELPAVLASADSLPFDDASLGAVLCWNALQAFPDAAPAAIAEVGRCLRPGGTFTLLTFRMATDPVARHFQAAHHLPGHPDGLRLFDIDALKGWLADAGLRVRHESSPGTFVFITAERAA